MFSILVLLVDEFLSEEWLLAHSEPELAVQIALRPPVQVLKEALGALLHHLFELVSAFTLFGGRVGRLQQTQLVHEESVRANVDRLGVGHDLPNDSLRLVLLGVANHLLQALLNEASQVDYAAIASTLDLVVLEENVGAEEVDGLVDDIVA